MHFLHLYYIIQVYTCLLVLPFIYRLFLLSMTHFLHLIYSLKEKETLIKNLFDLFCHFSFHSPSSRISLFVTSITFSALAPQHGQKHSSIFLITLVLLYRTPIH